ncbi:MAG: c-type cytochrome, partial [Planctomycetota bacterium]
AEYGNASDLNRLQKAFDACPATDLALQHSIRIALRNRLSEPNTLSTIWSHHAGQLPSVLAGVLPGIDSQDAAFVLLSHFLPSDNKPISESKSERDALRLAAREMILKHFPAGGPRLEKTLAAIPHLAKAVSKSSSQDAGNKTSNDLAEAELLAEMIARYKALHGTGNTSTAFPNGGDGRSLLVRHGVELLEKLLQRAAALGKEALATSWLDDRNAIWELQARISSDGVHAELLSSHTNGESYTGTLSSDAFICPGQIEFWIAGHNGFPNDEDLRVNFVRLVDSKTGQTRHTAYPPRSDTAKRIVWKTEQEQGSSVRIEIVDGCSLNAYAWLAVGRFSDLRLDPSAQGTKLFAAMKPLLAAGCGRLIPSSLNALLSTLPRHSRIRVDLLSSIYRGSNNRLAAALCAHAVQHHACDLVPNAMEPKQPAMLELGKRLSQQATSRIQRDLVGRLLKSKQGMMMANDLLDSGDLASDAFAKFSVEQVPTTLDLDLTEKLRQVILDSKPSNSINIDAWVARLSKQEPGTVEEGRKVFQKHCVNCHQLRGQGKLIGPQLDGAIQRPTARLLQDILLPNINVDSAFSQTTVLLDTDEVLVGLVRELDDNTLQITTSDGKQRTIASSQVVGRKQNRSSLMPNNFEEVLSPAELNALLVFLRSTPKQP